MTHLILAALLWAPASGFSDWRAFDALLDRFPRAHVTLAADLGEIPPDFKARLKERIAQGKVEVVLRLPGDPLLPLAYSSRPQDVMERLAVARAEYRQALGVEPRGFMPGAGELTPQAAQALAAQHIAWAAVGAEISTAPWTAGRLAVVPFQAFASSDSARAAQASRYAVIDEDSASMPPGSSLSELADLLGGSPDLVTVSEALSLYPPSASAPPGPWPGWTSDHYPWAQDPVRREAAALYAQAAAAMTNYQNSGSASLASLDKATQALRAAQSARFYKKGALLDASTNERWRALLRTAFEAAHSPVELSTASASTQEWAQRVLSSSSPQGLWFSQDSGLIRKLEVDWDQDAVHFTVQVSTLSNEQNAPYGFSPLMLELYVDLNHLAGQGSTALLPGVPGFTRAKDAWEYALVLTGYGGALYRSSPQGSVLAQEFPPAADLARAEIKISVPRARLRGNPAAWGYLLLALRTDARAARLKPSEPISDQANPMLGILGSGDGSPPFSALRAGSGN